MNDPGRNDARLPTGAERPGDFLAAVWFLPAAPDSVVRAMGSLIKKRRKRMRKKKHKKMLRRTRHQRQRGK